ncbi:MAG TPA: hypothetical protein ENK66_08805 [Arcobacter sp.]|nr:hypothetical protein [Arcobacter sp.]
MNYLIVVALQFFRWALAWVSRELVLLIVMALVTSFFAEFRQLLLTIMDFIKNRVQSVFNELSSLTKELEDAVKTLSINLEKLTTKVNDFNAFLVDKLDQVKKSIARILNTKTKEIKDLLNIRVLSRLHEIREDIKKLPIGKEEKSNILRKLTFAEKGVTKVISTAESINIDINTLVDKKLNQVTKKVYTLPPMDTKDLNKKMEKLSALIEESNKKINSEIDEIFSTFDEEQVREILEAQILGADEEIFENASDTVSGKIKKKIKTPNSKKIKWLNLQHREKAHKKHAQKFKINDIYRILVENFDRDERIALALRFAKKDHFKMKK